MRLSVLILITFITLTSPSPATMLGTQEWGEVAPSERSLLAPIGYPDSKALVIFDRGFVVSEISGIEFERHLRAIILAPAGADIFSSARIETREYDDIDDVRAAIYKQDGRTIEIKGDQIVKEKDNEFRSVTISFADLEPGDILEYYYKIKYYGGVDKLGAEKYFLFSQSIAWQWLKNSENRQVDWDEDLHKNVSNLPAWYFDHDVFTLYSRFQVKLGAELDYTCVPSNLPVEKQQPDSRRGSGIIDRVYKYHTWEMEDIPHTPTEPFMGHPDNFRPSLHFELFSTNGENRIILARYVDEHWRNVGRNMQGYLNMYTDKKPRRFRDMVKKLLDGVTDEEDRARTLYEHVRDKYEQETWSYELRPVQKYLRDYYKKKSGSPLEQNLMLVEMLKAARIDAWPVLINTRGETSFRRTARFNHAVVYAHLESGGLFMDATQPGCPFGTLPPFCLVEEGLLVDFDSPRIASLLTDTPDSFRRDSITVRLDVNRAGACYQTTWLGGYLAMEASNHLLVNSDLSESDSLPPALAGLERLDELGWAEDTPIGALQFKGKLVSVAGETDAFSLASIIWPVIATNPFELPVRHQPIDFRYARRYEAIVSLSSVTAEVAAAMPADTTFEIAGASFELSSVPSAVGLDVFVSLNIKQDRFEVAAYSQLRRFFLSVEALLNRSLLGD